LVGAVTVWGVGVSLISPRQTCIGSPPEDLPANVISIASKSGTALAGWHLTQNPCKGVVVLLHPIRGSRLTMLQRARLLYQNGYSIVMVDLQAHGESYTKNITLGSLEKYDARAAVEFAHKMHPNQPVAVLGVSLGGAAALLASPLKIDALILESIFPDITRAVHNRVRLRLGAFSAIPSELLLFHLNIWLGISRFELRPIDCLPFVDCPLLVISGTEDQHTTALETKEIYDSVD